MRQHQAEPLLLPTTDEAVQIAERRTTAGYWLALLAMVGLWFWHYVVTRHFDPKVPAVILSLFGGSRIVASLVCRLEPSYTWMTVSFGWGWVVLALLLIIVH